VIRVASSNISGSEQARKFNFTNAVISRCRYRDDVSGRPHT